MRPLRATGVKDEKWNCDKDTQHQILKWFIVPYKLRLFTKNHYISKFGLPNSTKPWKKWVESLEMTVAFRVSHLATFIYTSADRWEWTGLTGAICVKATLSSCTKIIFRGTCPESKLTQAGYQLHHTRLDTIIFQQNYSN